MRLVKCPACHNDVSDEAQSCPKCGQPLTEEIKRQPSEKREWRIALGVVAAIVVFIWVVASHMGGNLIRHARSGYTELVLYRFQGGSDGSVPVGGLITDRAGDLYGTTWDGGDTNGDGTVFKLTPDGSGGYSESVLYRFQGGNGADDPVGGLVMDSAGNLYGAAAGGIRNCALGIGCGVVFKLAPNGSGGYTESVLYRFQGGSDGESPRGLIMDRAGNLYGTTSDGGGIRNCPLYDRECGVVFKLAANGSGGYTESVIYRFRGGTDGWLPYGRLSIDRTGNLYGTTGFGGKKTRECPHYGCGVVFKLAPDGGGAYTESVLYRFRGGRDGAGPKAGLIMDRAGNLYGTTVGGGGSSKCDGGCGTVFKLTPDGSGGYSESVLYRFTGWSNGWSPETGLILDRAGNLYGTTGLGGNNTGNCSPAIAGCGVVYEIHLH